MYTSAVIIQNNVLRLFFRPLLSPHCFLLLTIHMQDHSSQAVTCSQSNLPATPGASSQSLIPLNFIQNQLPSIVTPSHHVLTVLIHSSVIFTPPLPKQSSGVARFAESLHHSKFIALQLPSALMLVPKKSSALLAFHFTGQAMNPAYHCKTKATISHFLTSSQRLPWVIPLPQSGFPAFH